MVVETNKTWEESGIFGDAALKITPSLPSSVPPSLLPSFLLFSLPPSLPPFLTVIWPRGGGHRSAPTAEQGQQAPLHHRGRGGAAAFFPCRPSRLTHTLPLLGKKNASIPGSGTNVCWRWSLGSSRKATTDVCAVGSSLSFLPGPRVPDPWASTLITGKAALTDTRFRRKSWPSRGTLGGTLRWPVSGRRA